MVQPHLKFVVVLLAAGVPSEAQPVDQPIPVYGGQGEEIVNVKPITPGKIVARAYKQTNVAFAGQTLAPFLRYALYVPSSYDSNGTTRWPVIFAFPGDGECISSMYEEFVGPDSANYGIARPWISDDSCYKLYERSVAYGMGPMFKYNVANGGVLSDGGSGIPAQIFQNDDANLFTPFVVLAPVLPRTLYPEGRYITWTACWVRDCLRRYKLDSTRVYFTGLCGGSRVQFNVAYELPHLPAAMSFFSFPSACLDPGCPPDPTDSFGAAGVEFGKVKSVALIPTRMWQDQKDQDQGDGGAIYFDSLMETVPGNDCKLHLFMGSTCHCAWDEPYHGGTYAETDNGTLFAWLLAKRNLNASCASGPITSVGPNGKGTPVAQPGRSPSGTVRFYTADGRLAGGISGEAGLALPLDRRSAASGVYFAIGASGTARGIVIR